ncbi:MAG: phosphotransferase [Ilumatobacter sp.]
MTHPLIQSTHDVTAAWCTELLRSTGDLGSDAAVTVAEVAPFGGAEGMVSSILRVELDYDRQTEAPSSLIIKLASQNDEMRFIADMLQFYAREVRFYRELRTTIDVTTPRCFLAEMYPDGQGFIVVLEEVTGCRGIDQIEGMSFNDAQTAVEMLADFHAPFWGKVEPDLAEALLPFNSPVLQQLIPAQNFEAWQKVRSKLVDDFPPELVAVFDSFVETAPRIMDDLMGEDTVTHGDCRADNLLFSPAGDVIALDFQMMTNCSGLTDVAYLLSQSLHPDAQVRTPELIEAYFARLATLEVDVDRDAAMKAYIAATIFFLGIPINILGNEGLHERSVQLSRTMIERGVAEIVRTGAHLRYA